MGELTQAIQNFNIETVVGNVWWFTMFLIVFDVGTGVLASAKEKKLNSSISYIGMIRKLGLFLALGFCVFMDAYFQSQGYITKLSVGMILLYEGMSIVENFSRIGIDLGFLTKYFQPNKVGKEEEKKGDVQNG